MTITTRFCWILIKGYVLLFLMAAPVVSEAQLNVAGQNKMFQYSSTSDEEIRELSIGEQVPDLEFALMNYDLKRAKFSDFRGKYIILDFWATWCTACLKSFPKLDSIQERNSGKLQVLLVNTTDEPDKVADFFSKKRGPNGLKYHLPTVFDDSMFNLLFPHKIIPHYVWIDSNGVIQAITGSEEMTHENILGFIAGEKINFNQKRDIDFDQDKPLFVHGNGGGSDAFLYRSFLTGYLEGIPGASRIVYDEQRRVSRIYAVNSSILMLYKLAYPELYQYPKSRVICDLGDSLNYERLSDNLVRNNCFSYELLIPPTASDKAIDLMREDLRRYFGLNVLFKQKKLKCYVLKCWNKSLVPKSKGGPSEYGLDDGSYPKLLRNHSLSVLVDYLNDKTSIPIIDETGIKDRIEMEFGNDLTNLAELNQSLLKYGLSLTQDQRWLEVVVISNYKEDVR